MYALFASRGELQFSVAIQIHSGLSVAASFMPYGRPEQPVSFIAGRGAQRFVFGMTEVLWLAPWSNSVVLRS